MVRRAARKDANHNLIAEFFKSAGATVADTSQLGNGFPDMVIGIYGLNLLIEVKDGDKPPSKQQLTDDEFKFFHNWKGWVQVVHSIEDAKRVLHIALQEKTYRIAGFTAQGKA